MSLDERIAAAIDEWMRDHPSVTVMQVLAALENVRHTLTETFLNESEGHG